MCGATSGSFYFLSRLNILNSFNLFFTFNFLAFFILCMLNFARSRLSFNMLLNFFSKGPPCGKPCNWLTSTSSEKGFFYHQYCVWTRQLQHQRLCSSLCRSENVFLFRWVKYRNSWKCFLFSLGLDIVQLKYRRNKHIACSIIFCLKIERCGIILCLGIKSLRL